MNKFKICLLGSFSVGKTSLVRRFVERIFSERYETTIGVRVDKKMLQIDNSEVTLILWDLAGEDEFEPLRASYLRGISGYILVADGTRELTLDVACRLQKRVAETEGAKPFVLLLNKYDLKEAWTMNETSLALLKEKGWHLYRTSAKTGEDVEAAFENLTRRILAS